MIGASSKGAIIHQRHIDGIALARARRPAFSKNRGFTANLPAEIAQARSRPDKSRGVPVESLDAQNSTERFFAREAWNL
jgi:hypothetical protein